MLRIEPLRLELLSIELLYQAAAHSSAKRVLIINAHSHALLTSLNAQYEQLDLYQHFKPEHACIQHLGLTALTSLPEKEDLNPSYDKILILPSKSKQQTLGWMAKAMLLLHDHGIMMMACANIHGSKSYESALKTLSGKIISQSKSKCRVFSTRKTTTLDTALLSQWLHAAQTRTATHGLITQPGLFSWDHADLGSQLLIDHLPLNLTGKGMDLCCGYGLLSQHIINTYPNIETLHLLEADRLALHCAEKNTQAYASKITTHWRDATSDTLPSQLDWIVCNPPFHIGQTTNIELGQQIIKRACQALKRHGTLYIVANRKLPYETLMRSELSQCSTLIEANGFKIIKGIR